MWREYEYCSLEKREEQQRKAYLQIEDAEEQSLTSAGARGSHDACRTAVERCKHMPVLRHHYVKCYLRTSTAGVTRFPDSA